MADLTLKGTLNLLGTLKAMCAQASDQRHAVAYHHERALEELP